MDKSMDSRLDLDTVIRPTLVGMEDRIIMNLLGRAKYKTDRIIHEAGGIPIEGFDGSLFDFLLRGIETTYALAGCFEHPTQYSFSEDLPKPIVQREEPESPIVQTGLNFNVQIRATYLESLGDFCEEGDDGEYGSAAVSGIRCLRSLSERIHFGTYVAESKYQEDPREYQRLIDGRDVGGILAKLTNLPVEEAIFKRVQEKGERYGVDPRFVAEFYRDKIIPLTKDVEIEYFLKRK